MLVPALIILVCLGLAGGLVYLYLEGAKGTTQTASEPERVVADVEPSKFDAVYAHFGIKPLPHKVISDFKTLQSLETLEREKCDISAAF
ncbi:MAG: hypothetical protein AAGI06_09060, partial [Pseudomonadota bacterium]